MRRNDDQWMKNGGRGGNLEKWEGVLERRCDFTRLVRTVIASHGHEAARTDVGEKKKRRRGESRQTVIVYTYGLPCRYTYITNARVMEDAVEREETETGEGGAKWNEMYIGLQSPEKEGTDDLKGGDV